MRDPPLHPTLNPTGTYQEAVVLGKHVVAVRVLGQRGPEALAGGGHLLRRRSLALQGYNRCACVRWQEIMWM